MTDATEPVAVPVPTGVKSPVSTPETASEKFTVNCTEDALVGSVEARFAAVTDGLVPSTVTWREAV